MKTPSGLHRRARDYPPSRNSGDENSSINFEEKNLTGEGYNE